MAKKAQTPKPEIRKIARIEDKTTSTFVEEIEFAVLTIERRRIRLLPSVVNSLSQFKSALLDAGALLPKSTAQLRRLLESVAKSEAPEQWAYAPQVGWVNEGKAYVTANGILGDIPGGRIVGVNTSSSIKAESGRLSNSGTSEAWRDDVAKPASSSSIMMFVISTALAAPLLYFVKRRSFTINIFGETRKGKTFATLVGASLPGIGRVQDLITWRITDTRLEQRLPEYNDAMFPIEDLETMREKESKEKYLRIRNLAYGLEQGWAMARDQAYTMGHGGVHEHWRCIAVTSYEKSIRDLAQSVNMERQPGETLRLIDVPALLGGKDYIFDRLPTPKEGDDFEKWKQGTFSRIADACERNHGIAFEKYIRDLIANRDRLKKHISKCVDHFVKRVRSQGDGDVARDVAQKFGLIFAGGMLGIRYGLLPWKQSELLDAISKCYFGARELLPDDGVALRKGLQALLKLLKGLPLSKGLARTAYSKADGYCELEPTSRRYLIRREVFNKSFTSGHERALVLKWLIGKRWLTLAIPKAAPAGSPLPKVQHDWPDGERVRSYEIRIPRKSKTRTPHRKGG